MNGQPITAQPSGSPFPDGPMWLVSRPDGKEPKIVTGCATAEEAFEKASCGFSVYEIKCGATRAVWRLGKYPEMFYAKYDGPPMTESHSSTGAKKIVTSLGRPV